jgi:hypothetical protein
MFTWKVTGSARLAAAVRSNPLANADWKILFIFIFEMAG